MKKRKNNNKLEEKEEEYKSAGMKAFKICNRHAVRILYKYGIYEYKNATKYVPRLLYCGGRDDRHCGGQPCLSLHLCGKMNKALRNVNNGAQQLHFSHQP